MNKQIEKMRKLGMSDEEISQVLADDKRIDKGEKLFELTAEQKQAEKKARQADRKPTVYKFDKKERKPNEQKRDLINLLTGALAEHCENVNVVNAEREFTFTYGNTKYKIVLSAPRS